MGRRTLRLQSLDEAGSEAARLIAAGYDRVGAWSLAQVCEHMAIVITMSIDGFPSRFPWPMRVVARWLYLKPILAHHVFRKRLPAPKYVLPADTTDDAVGVERLRAAIQRFGSHPGPFAPSPVFGDLTPEQWREIHLWHCEHHFSFLLPKG